MKTAEDLKERIRELGISYDLIAMDNRDSFQAVFGSIWHGRRTEENSCRLEHRMRRVLRRTCCSPKRLLNHI